LARGFYWQPILREFCAVFPESIVFTGLWPGFIPGYQDSFSVRICGKTTFLKIKKNKNRYDRVFALPPFSIVIHLLKFKPDVIFTSAFSIWSLISIFFKIFQKTKVLIIYEGSSPTIDMEDSVSRIVFRKLIVRFANGLITNTFAGKKYLIKCLHAEEKKVFSEPFEVPEKLALTKENPNFIFSCPKLKSPIFLYVGQVSRRKGVFLLIEACLKLKENGYDRYSLIIAGDGPDKKELENVIQKENITKNVIFAGWVNYNQLGYYYTKCDVFVLPTLEDTWGMVVLEAMLFGKPIMCSVFAGVKEVVKEGLNGYTFDPFDTGRLAKLMEKFIKNRSLTERMGYRSEEIISPYTPKTAAIHLESVLKKVCSNII
jgi:glycosyltransferase involved in cell wall biosynthesis